MNIWRDLLLDSQYSHIDYMSVFMTVLPTALIPVVLSKEFRNCKSSLTLFFCRRIVFASLGILDFYIKY